jgi:hypothetical protein
VTIIPVVVAGIDVNDGVKYAVGNDTLNMLEAAVQYEPIMVDMEARAPWYVRRQPQARSVTLIVHLLERSMQTRYADYVALRDALDTDLVTLSWTVGTAKSLTVFTSTLLANAFFSRASAELIAPDPVPA